MKRMIVIIVLVAAPVFADDVYLKGGGRITGEIIELTQDSVTVDVGGGGTMTARMASVVRIEKGDSPLQEYRQRAANIPTGDAEAWRQLAQWATGYALSSQAAKAYTQVVAILPDDEEANKALGRVWFDGKWVAEDEAYRAQGYILFEGEWMTPGERQSILANRQARAQANEEANEAAIQAINAEQQAAKEQKEAEQQADEFYRNPVSWTWGAGPGYWPRPQARRW